MTKNQERGESTEQNSAETIRSFSGALREYYGSENFEAISNSLTEAKDKATKYIRENPEKSALIAFGAGLLLGWLFSSSKDNE